MMIVTTEVIEAAKRQHRYEIASQVAIFVFGVTAIWLSQSPDRAVSAWACVFGLASQPFFFYSTWRAKQWGMLLLTCFYAFAWARGVNTFWLGWF